MIISTRVVTFTIDHGLEMGLIAYPTETAARNAARTSGGIVLPVDSEYLKTLFTPEDFSVEGVKQSSLSAILRESSEDHDCAIFVENSIGVDYSSLEHHLVPEFVKVADGEEIIHVMEFGDEAKAWYAALEAELGAFVHVE
jgi:hypothetical protein